MSDNANEDKQKNRSWFDRITAMLAGEPQNREELMDIIRDAEDRDVLSEELLGMIERILQVSEMQVREVMIPKAQMIIAKESHSLNDILPIIIESGHSRFPVFSNNDKDVIGILLAKDLLPYTFNKKTDDFILKDQTRPAIFVPQSKRLDILLREFRDNHNHMAIVLDEYSHVAGLVTIEDVLEQIVGEIEDEYDFEEEDAIKKLSDGAFIVKATTEIEEFNEYFNTDFRDDEFDTIGGIVMQQFGYLPKRGESVMIETHIFKILHSDNRRIYLLEVKPIKD